MEHVEVSAASSSAVVGSKITIIFLKLIILPFGIFVKTGRKRFENAYTLIFLFVFMTLFAGQIKCYETLDSLLHVLDNSMYVIATLVATVFLVKARRGEHLFEEFHRNTIQSYEYGGDEFFDETDSRLKRLATVVGLVITFSCVGVIVYPIMNAWLTDVDLGSPSTLIYLSFYPWRIDTVPKYIATIVLQLCSGSVVCSVVGCMIFFLLYCVVVLQVHCDILIRKIRKMDEMMRAFDELDFRQRYDGELYCRIRYEINEKLVEELRSVIKYHQFVNRFVYNMIDCCTCIVDTSTAAVFSCIVILITIFVMGSGDYMYQLKIVSISMITFCLFCIECYIGEILNHVNSEILLQTYNVKWYRRTSRFKKLLLLIMTRCQLPFQIRAFNMLNVNFIYFTTLLKNTYSVLQFILRMQRDT